ncbi:EamA family transporter [Vallicoccus soli]|uniref:EamA/RhaT family transporter n=1 Tax=Vallicoccus soli TaxID=2339232 RepID=A0A3A3YZN8_9ACTN|nr:EamA family transporter [Vallicoccus soli]RJK97220.1 EamA/RhaT family transporter [Vallicoccus soli]
MPTSTPTLPLRLVALAAVLWGTGGLLGAALSRTAGTGPLLTAALRLVVGGLAVTWWLVATGRFPGPLRRRGGPAPRVAALRRLGVVAVCAATYQAAYFAAVALTSVSLATLVTLGSCPVLVTLAAAAVDRRAPGRATAAALALAVTGLVLLVGAPAAPADPARTAAGVALALAAAGGFTAMTLATRRSLPGLAPAASAGPAFLAGGLLLLPVGLLAGPVGDLGDPRALLLVAALGLLPTAAAYVAWFRGLPGVAAPVAAVAALLEPLTATVLSVLLLGERLSPLGALGAALVAAAVAGSAASAAPAPRPRAGAGTAQRGAGSSG